MHPYDAGTEHVGFSPGGKILGGFGVVSRPVGLFLVLGAVAVAVVAVDVHVTVVSDDVIIPVALVVAAAAVTTAAAAAATAATTTATTTAAAAAAAAAATGIGVVAVDDTVTAAND